MQSQKSGPLLATGAVLPPAVLVLSIILLVGGSPAGVCSPTGPSVSVDAANLPKVAVAGYRGEQLENGGLTLPCSPQANRSPRYSLVGRIGAAEAFVNDALQRAAGPGVAARRAGAR